MTLPKNVEDLLPLTPMQHLMLLHVLTAPTQRALVNQVSYEIGGPLREDAFRAAWDAAVARHPALRTAFLWEGLEQPLQVVRSHVTLPFRTIDLSSVPAAEQQNRIDELALEDLTAPMGIGKAPLMRCTLVRTSDEAHRFIWTVHHLVVDRWSYGTLLSELRLLYAALLEERDAGLPPARAFREYVAWLAQRDAGAAERFWRHELRGFTEPNLLVDDGPRIPGRQRRTTHHRLDAEVSSALRARAVEWRTTLAALILAGTGIALSRHFRRDDVLCGLTVSGRPPDLDGAEAIVGSFVNNVPVRLRIDRGRPLAEWVRAVQRDQMRRQPFEHVSLRDIRAWADVPYPRPLFDTLLLLNVADEQAPEWPGIEIRPLVATLDAAYPLLLAAGADGPNLELTLVHDDVFDAGGLLTGVSAAVGELASAREDAAVGALVPEFAGTASERPHEGAPGPTAPDERVVPAARTELPNAMLQLWRDVLGSPDVGLDDDFFGLGGSSLQAVELLARLERLVGRTVPVSTLFAAGSVRGLLTELGKRLEYDAPLVRLRSSGTRPPLVAVPGIGGNVLGLAGLARALGPDQPFFALQSPGLDGREAPLTTIERIAERYVEQVLTGVEGPYDLLGFCWGAAVAFEMAGRLQSAGRAPRSLQLIDPAALLRDTSSGGASAEATFLRRRLELYWGELRDADWRQRGRFVAGKARRVAGVLARDERREESREELNRFKVERANRQAVIRYIPGRYEGRATLFLSSGRVFEDGQDPRLEWLQLISPAPDILLVDGVDSGDVISPAHVVAFATMLRDRLDAPGEPSTTSQAHQ